MKTLMLIFFSMFICYGSHAQQIGFSGMVNCGDSKYLVVSDKKNHKEGKRVALLKVNEKEAYSLKTLKVEDWKHKDGRSSDLESVCAIPGKKNDYLLVESGYWNGKFGRIFHVELEKEKLKVKHVYNVPKLSPAGKDNPLGDNFEGSICLKHKDDLFIVLGERGGTSRFPNGILRIGVLKKGAKEIDWTSLAKNNFEAKLPKSFKKPSGMRTISDLHISDDGIIYASAAIDDSDIGPFKSIIYPLCSVHFKNNELRLKALNSKVFYTVEGFKVEALAASPKFINNSNLCIGTEDEFYTGQWRAIYSK